MRKSITGLVLLLALAAGCTDATIANVSSLGSTATVKQFSGGVLVNSWRSTGKVVTVDQSDGWQFKDAATGRFVRVSGDIVIEN